MNHNTLEQLSQAKVEILKEAASAMSFYVLGLRSDLAIYWCAGLSIFGNDLIWGGFLQCSPFTGGYWITSKGMKALAALDTPRQ